MDKRELSPVVRLLVGAIVYAGVVTFAIWMLGGEAWWMLTLVALVLAAALSPFIGAGIIWLIVRRANRRDDPQHVDRPSR